MLMKVAMMQPTFLPWVGYFELLACCDKFIILDDFQFVYQSFHSKNKLFVNIDAIDWYTVPVDKKISFQQPINIVRIKESIPWRKKLWKRLENNYSKACYFYEVKDTVKNIILEPTDSLLKQNMRFINYIAEILDCTNKIEYSSNITKKGKRSEEVLTILKAVNADVYLSAHGSFEYMYNDKIFPVKDIELLFQNHIPKVYKQNRSNKFIPFLSMLDALFNLGEQGIRKILYGTDRWLTWDEMVNNYIGGKDDEVE